MTNILLFPEQSRVQKEASQWLVRLDGGSISEEEVEAFSEWLNSNRQHRDAIVELCRLWDNMEILSELSVLFPYDHKVSSQPKSLSIWFKKPVLLFTAATVSILLMMTLFLHQRFEITGAGGTVSQRSEISYQTLVGKQKNIVLEDGSIANLNTDSLVVVNFTEKQRSIRLVKGEAYFQVEHEPSRPFFVHAGGGLVRAVGTAFSVRLKGKNMEVTVTEGTVEVASAIIDEKKEIDDLNEVISDEYLTTLGVGQTAEFGEKTINMVKTIEPAAVMRKLSWQKGMLEFKGETLEEVVSEISRYTNKIIIISDASIRDIRIGGYFKTGEVDVLLAVLKGSFPITVNQINDDLIYLSEGNSPQTTISN